MTMLDVTATAVTVHHTQIMTCRSCRTTLPTTAIAYIVDVGRPDGLTATLCAPCWDAQEARYAGQANITVKF